MTGRSILKGWFSTAKKPTQGQFWELIDSYWHKTEDSITVADISGLSSTLAGKASTVALNAEAIARADGDNSLLTLIQDETAARVAADALKADLVSGKVPLSQLPAGAGFNMTAYIEAAPLYDNEAAALVGGIDPYSMYKTSTGELRYKLPNPLTPEPPTDGIVDDDADTFTFTGGLE